MEFKSDYYYGNESEQYIFYRIPKVLFTEPHFKKMSNFDYMKDVDINDVDIENLVDIKDISVDKTLPKDKRIEEYIKQTNGTTLP